jgi:hypothetical protein
VAIVYVGRELGVICLPGTNIIVSAFGFLFDMLLDIFVIIRSFLLYRRAEQDDRLPQLVLLTTCISLFSWHLVFSLLTVLTVERDTYLFSN